jgi:hemolysin activation/secretion protein
MNNHPTIQRKHTPRWGIVALLAASAPVLAQTTPPTAGQTLRELQGQPAAPTQRNAISLVVPPDADTSADPGLSFAVRTVRIEGNVKIASAELLALVAPLNGRDATLGELRQAAAKITALYRERGFIVARAFVPAQEIRDGVVLISVLEGSLASTSVINKSIIRTPSLEAIPAAQGLTGKIIQAAEMDRELLLMADLPAAGAVNGVLKPGKEVGTSDMVITVDPGKSQEGQVSLDNYGNRYTGQIRLNGNIDVNSPLKIGDRLSLRATVTDERLLYGQVAYDLPANGDGWRVGADLSSSHYDLGHEFSNLDASGTSNTAGLYTSYPALRGLNANIWLRGALDYRKLKDDVRATATVVRKNVTVGTAEAYGDLSDALGGGAYSTWRATLRAGKLDIDSASALLIDEAGPQSNGSFHKVELAATRLQAITPLTSAFFSFAGQWAGNNLDSSEKFVLGGMYGVRAYPQGEGVGDEGWLASVELRQSFTAGLQGSVFYDHGHIDYNHHAFAPTTNETTLKGYGLELALRYQLYELKATVAWRNGQVAQSAPDHNPRFWLSARRVF